MVHHFRQGLFRLSHTLSPAWKRFRAARLFGLAVSMVVVLTVAACSTPEKETEEPVTLKILAPKYSLRIQQLDLVQLYKAARPHVELEVVDLLEKTRSPREDASEADRFSLLDDLQSADAPDVVVLQWNPLLFKSLIEQGLLLSLDSFMEKEHMDLSQFAPIVREALTSPTDGSLYGLAPMFSSYVLFYNKDLLDAQGIPYPQDGETWEELWSKAEVFAHPPGSEADAASKNGARADMLAQVGVEFQLNASSSDTVMFIELMLNQQGRQQEALLQALEEGKTPVFNTPERRALWEQVIDLQKRGVLNIPDAEKPQDDRLPNGDSDGPRFVPYGLQNSAFMKGEAPFLLASWQQAIELYGIMSGDNPFGPLLDQQTIEPFAWDIVTFPVHPASPEEGSPVEMQTVFVIPSKAHHPEEAWRFIRTVHNEKVAKIIGQSSEGGRELMTYLPANRAPVFQDIHAEAFWKLTPTSFIDVRQYYDPVSNDAFFMLREVYQALTRAYQKAREGNTSIEDALRDAEQSWAENKNKLEGRT